jgi:hypothetical protein
MSPSAALGEPGASSDCTLGLPRRIHRRTCRDGLECGLRSLDLDHRTTLVTQRAAQFRAAPATAALDPEPIDDVREDQIQAFCLGLGHELFGDSRSRSERSIASSCLSVSVICWSLLAERSAQPVRPAPLPRLSRHSHHPLRPQVNSRRLSVSPEAIGEPGTTERRVLVAMRVALWTLALVA